MARTTSAAILLGVLLALGAFSAACGGDSNDDKGNKTPVATETTEATDEVGGDEPTDEPSGDTAQPSSELTDYFQDLDDAENDFRAAQDARGAEFAALGDTTPVEDAVDLISDLRNAVDDFVGKLEDIDPPAEAAAPHEETIAGFQVVSDTIGDALDAADSGATTIEVLDFFETPEALEAQTALDATCNALQQIATDNGIDVDLGCQN